MLATSLLGWDIRILVICSIVLSISTLIRAKYEYTGKLKRIVATVSLVTLSVVIIHIIVVAIMIIFLLGYFIYRFTGDL